MEDNKNIATEGLAVQEVQEESYKSGSIQYIDSREVAEIVEKKHCNLVRDIKRYTKELTQLNFEFSEFFIESTYKDVSGKSNKCYLVTKKGCEFIAHKLTGIKGTKFTATYINRFHEMEDTLKSGELAQIIREFDKRIKYLEYKTIEVKKPANPYGVSSNVELEECKKELYSLTAKVAELCKMSQTKVLHYMYRTMEEKLGVTLNAYKSVYMSETGKTDVCMVEVIASDSRLYETATQMNREVIERKQIYG